MASRVRIEGALMHELCYDRWWIPTYLWEVMRVMNTLREVHGTCDLNNMHVLTTHTASATLV